MMNIFKCKIKWINKLMMIIVIKTMMRIRKTPKKVLIKNIMIPQGKYLRSILTIRKKWMNKISNR
jgi:hypothetical protein